MYAHERKEWKNWEGCTRIHKELAKDMEAEMKVRMYPKGGWILHYAS